MRSAALHPFVFFRRSDAEQRQMPGSARSAGTRKKIPLPLSAVLSYHYYARRRRGKSANHATRLQTQAGNLMDFTWLHLTDFHQGMDEQSWLWPGIKENFFEDLKCLHDKCGPWDLVLFTGDITRQGRVEEFQRFDEMLAQLWEHFNSLGSSPRLLTVPGNHDLVRPNMKHPAAKLLRQWHDDPDIQEDFWKNAESPYREVITGAFENYTAWGKEKQAGKETDGLHYGMLPGDFSVSMEKDGGKLGIVGLNTAFLQLTGDDYEGRLVLHARQFQEACGGDGPVWAKQHHACLLLTHHPQAWLSPESQQHLNGEIAGHGRFAACLCGHAHETAYRCVSEGGAEAKCIWQSRSLFGLKHFKKAGEEMQRSHGYTIGKIELNEDKKDKGVLTFWPRVETRLQGGQRTIIAEASTIKLTPEGHTFPKDFKLIAPYVSENGTESRNKLNTQSYKHDIFVSYAHVDNESPPGTNKAWVTTLVHGLKNCIGQRLGRADACSFWMDDESRGNESLTAEIIKQLRNSAILLLILSPAYTKSQWCRSELGVFLAETDKNSGRVFIIERGEAAERLEELRDLPSYKFWRKGEDEYYRKLDDFARDLSHRIKDLKEKKAEKGSAVFTTEAASVPPERTVFLAVVSDDLEEHRDEVKRYLEQQGLRVLPGKACTFDNMKQCLEQDLPQCRLFVQLLSEKTGHDLPRFQYERALAKKDLLILQWRNNALDLNSIHNLEHLQLLLQRTVMASSLVRFQEYITNQQKQQTETGKKQAKYVVINAAPEDMSLAHRIKDIFKAQKIGCCLPLDISVHTKATEIQTYLKQNLLHCDAVIVLYENTSVLWVNEQVLYCRRMQGLRKRPFKVFAVCKPLAEKPPLPMYLPDLHMLECPTLQTDYGLPRFIKMLKR